MIVLLTCLMSQVFGKTLAEDAYALVDAYSSFTYDHRVMDGNENPPFECYSCGAYRHSDGDDFDAKLKGCLKRHEDSDIVACPAIVDGQPAYKQCRTTKQTIFGHVTSFSRGCPFLMPCNELRNCEDDQRNMTGVCQQCCTETLCNSSTRHTNIKPIMVLIVIGLLWYCM